MLEKGRYAVKIVVEKQEGHCAAGHKVGDTWIIDDAKTPAGLCTHAFASMFPRISLLEFGGAQPWRQNPDNCRAACPDGPNPVWFEITRLHPEKDEQE